MPGDDIEVPGTVRIFDHNGESLGGEATLTPAPSADPEDPLNWSRPRKFLNLFCVMMYVASCAFIAGAIYPIFVPLHEQTGLSLAVLNEGTGYMYFALGAGALVFQPAALAFGKKPIYVVTSLLLVPVSLWTMYARGDAQWLGNRLLFGFLGGPVFTISEASVADMFFYHERTWPMGCYVFSTYAFAFLSSIMGGCVYYSIGWRPVVIIPTAVQAACTIVLFFFLEETTYDRDKAPALVPKPVGPVETDDEKKGDASVVVVPTLHGRVAIHEHQYMATPWPGIRPFAYKKPIAGWAGVMVRGVLFSLALIACPMVLWLGLMFGYWQSMLNIFASLASSVLSEEPYGFNAKQVSLTYIAPLIATAPSSIGAGMLADWYSNRRAHLNGGVSEPEHKLDLFIFPVIAAPIGCLMMGLGPAYGAHWMVFVMGVFFINIAGPLATTICVAYTFDVFHPLMPEPGKVIQNKVHSSAPYLISTIFIAMCVTFGLGYAITPWAYVWGYKNFGISSAIVTFFVCASPLPVILYGKRIRAWQAKYYLKLINL